MIVVPFGAYFLRISSKLLFSWTGVNCVERNVKFPPPDVLAPAHALRVEAIAGVAARPSPNFRRLRREMLGCVRSIMELS
ncbi:hypothetical protein [Raineyella fluvialis]|uniref:hypothetical protein n=1 Tax=Raineyella fluvialis TaxID=2662261 RepID=UPI001E472864|nr:hypothetical protein [Raineyella fluvialis]